MGHATKNNKNNSELSTNNLELNVTEKNLHSYLYL